MRNNDAQTQQSCIAGTVLVEGRSTGELLVSHVGISFWGGIDTETGVVIDEHHPLKHNNVKDKILVIPSGRGSCSGSGALLELILNDCAPAALVFTEAEDILTLGVLVAQEMFDRTLPVIRIEHNDLGALKTGVRAEVDNGVLTLPEIDNRSNSLDINAAKITERHAAQTIELSKNDQDMLNGMYGDAAKMAMEILLCIAKIQGASKLIDVTQAHIDACIYHGPSSLAFAQALVKRGAKVRIPTTLNAISIDERRWREHGISENLGQPASQLGYAFMEMGAKPSFTCAPYLLNTAPEFSEQIVWAESNAVMFANSVIGARTQKYPDFLDIFIALTGRAPAAGSHMDDGRLPTLCIRVDPLTEPDDAFWPLLGYHIGLVAANDLPMIYGLDGYHPSLDDLKAFSAAFATSSSAAMFHMFGVTPESNDAHSWCEKKALIDNIHTITKQALTTSFNELNTAKSNAVDMVCIGNPHLSLTECETLARLVLNKKRDANVRFIVTLGREIHNEAAGHGYIDTLERFGVEIITDTCWCMITEPVIPKNATILMTNSGKYAHYGPALVQRDMHFANLESCVKASCTGEHRRELPMWLA